jgi:hypothetical protein
MRKVTRTFQRAIGFRAIRHSVVEHQVHAEDVAEAAERRSTYWVGVEVKPANDSHRVIESLGGGMYFTIDRQSGALMERDGDAFIKDMDAWQAEKSWYLREVNDAKCKSGKRWKKTQSNGLQGLVVSCAPWWSDVIYEAAQAGESERVKEFARRAATELKAVIEKQTHRQVLSVQAHFDTKHLHYHVFCTRIGADHKLIPGTKKKFGLIGPWACGVLRQGDEQVIPKDSTNYRQAEHIRHKTERRMGGGLPLDWSLCLALDLLCMTMFGLTAGASASAVASPRLTRSLQLYKRGLPEVAFARLLGLQDAVSREVAVWSKFMGKPRDYAPTAIRFGQRVNHGRAIYFN